MGEQTTNDNQESISFAEEVWQTLSSVDVSMFTADKGNFTYLSWAHAWATLMEFYPESTYKMLPFEIMPDGSMSVGMKVTVRRDYEKLSRKMWLQVLDHKNNPILEPTSHDINNARMRCLTKALSMCGLANYLYSGHELPIAEDALPRATRTKKVPRVPDDEMLARFIDKMDAAGTSGMLQAQYGGAHTYFKTNPDMQKLVEAKYKSLKATFDKAEQSTDKEVKNGKAS